MVNPVLILIESLSLCLNFLELEGIFAIELDFMQML